MASESKFDNQFIVDELTAICNSLGSIDESDGTYMRDRDCKPSLKEILRYLNIDKGKHVARVTLGSLNIVKADLIPLLVQYCDYNEMDPDLFSIVLRLCANLTSSILLLFENQEVPTDIEGQQLQNKLLNGLYGYKEAFASEPKVWSILNVHLKHNRDEDVTFERLIVLIRNIMHIPVDSSSDMGIHSDFDVHDMCLYQMEKSGMLRTLIEIASEDEKGTEYCFHITEIIYLMLRDQNSETIASATSSRLKRKLEDSDVDKKRLAELSERNRRQRLESAKYQPPRFKNSAFIVKNCKSLGEAPLIVNKLVCSRESINFDAGKTDLRKSKNRKPLSSETSMAFSDRNTKTSKVSYGLKNFCLNFVEKVYNNYMQQIKYNLIQKKAQDNDESYYLWCIQFFTCFSRHMNLSTDLISETLSSSTLHFIQILISSYQDKIKLEKKKYHDISKRLHLALRAYKEILTLINANKVDSIIFSETEYSVLILNLLQEYDEPKHSKHYLADLVQTNHIFLELLDEHCKKHEKSGDKIMTVSRYCHPDIIKAYMGILRDFRSNDDTTNLAILKFFERIVWDCQNDVILCQASVFKCLIDIMSYHSSLPGQDRFIALGKHLMESFGRKANKRRWMFQELLFWKHNTDVVEIENAIDPPPVLVEPEPTLSYSPDDLAAGAAATTEATSGNDDHGEAEGGAEAEAAAEPSAAPAATDDFPEVDEDDLSQLQLFINSQEDEEEEF